MFDSCAIAEYISVFLGDEIDEIDVKQKDGHYIINDRYNVHQILDEYYIIWFDKTVTLFNSDRTHILTLENPLELDINDIYINSDTGLIAISYLVSGNSNSHYISRQPHYYILSYNIIWSSIKFNLVSTEVFSKLDNRKPSLKDIFG